MEENNVLDFNNALDLLNTATDTFKVNAWVPSRSSEVTFKAIDAKQQKELLSAAMDSSVYNTSFIKVFYSILKNNIVNEDPSIIDDLTLADKASVAFSLRQQISSEINVIFDDEKKISNKININDIVQKFLSYQTPNEEIVNLSNDSYSINVILRLPTVKNEIEYDEQLKSIKKTEDIKSNEDIKTIISNAFIGETSKYISSIIINDNDVNFGNLNFDQKIQLVEKLPSTLIQNVLEVISKWKNDLDSITKVTFGDYSKNVNVDSILFLS